MNEQDQSDTLKYGPYGTVETQQVFSQAPSPGPTLAGLIEARSALKTKARAEPGNTPERRAYYNMLEMTESLTKITTDWPHQRPHLLGALKAEAERLEELRAERKHSTP